MRAGHIGVAVAVFSICAGCSTAGSDGASNTGGSKSLGGQQQSSSNGGSGGASNGGSSGSKAAGGGASSGGMTASGGAGPTGGSDASGGHGGNGGMLGSGGSTSSGGQAAAGDASSGGGTQASGGAATTGGTAGGGGLTSTGGTSASGGSEGRDLGTDALADAAVCTPGGTCTEPDKTVTSGTGVHCCYTYENWVNTGSATMTLKTDGFSVSWTGTTQFVGRKGIRPGSGSIVTEYTTNYSPNGNSYLCLYGWTTDPLAEYYVVDGWGSWRPPGGTSIGTVTSDGGTYDIYKMTRTNEPSIKGTATFPQYWSVRQQKKTSGTITLANHITAWAAKGMPMGTFYEVSMTVEGYQSNGTADVKFTMK